MKNTELLEELIKASNVIEKDSWLEEDVVARVEEVLESATIEELKEIPNLKKVSDVIKGAAIDAYMKRKLNGKFLNWNTTIPKEMLEFFKDDFLSRMDENKELKMEYLDDGSGVRLQRNIPAHDALKMIILNQSKIAVIGIMGHGKGEELN